MAFVIIGDSSRHGARPPVLLPDDGINFVFVNPSVVRFADVKQFASQADAVIFAAAVPTPCQIVEIPGVGVLSDELRSPISVLPTVGRLSGTIVP